MPLFDRPPIDAISVSNSLFSSGTFRITGGPGIVVGSDASGASVSASPNVGSFFENAVADVAETVSGLGLGSTSLNTNVAGGRLLIQPLAPANELFPFNISATRADLNFSGNFTAGSTTNASAAFSSTFLLGFYTRSNSTRIDIVNSVSRSITGPANVTNSAQLNGARYLSFHSSAFSSAPNFTEGGRYWFAQLIRTSGAIYTGPGAVISQFGAFHGGSQQRSGQLGSTASSNTSFNAWYPFMGVHSLTTHTVLPASIAHADVNKASTNANFIPHFLLNAGLVPLD